MSTEEGPETYKICSNLAVPLENFTVNSTINSTE